MRDFKLAQPGNNSVCDIKHYDGIPNLGKADVRFKEAGQRVTVRLIG